MADRWCPNCRQRVAPVREVGWLPAVVGWANAVALVVVFRWLPRRTEDETLFVASLRVPPLFGDWVWTVVLVIAAVAILSWGVLRWLTTRDRCPICRTTRLVGGPLAPV